MQLTILHTGFLKLDGGAMFGVVPKRMWAKLNPPDDNNLCTWAMRCLLVETGDRRILIDTGIGNKQDEKFRAHFEPHGTQTLLEALAAAGIPRETITDVFLTHLHFDHCGGALWKNEDTGNVELTFPNAVYWSNQRHWDWAMDPNPREKASFLKENFVPLLEQGRMQYITVQEDIEFCPGFRVRFVYGHTEAMMLPVLETEQGRLVYCADLIPSQWHVGLPYIMAYDIRPLDAMEEKARLLAEAAQQGDLLFFEHDPAAAWGKVGSDASGRIVLLETGNLI